MKPARLAAIALLPLLACSFQASADITRGCSASVSIFVMDKQASPYATLAQIDARASCKNKLNANDCRAGARTQIDRCLSDLWSGRNQDAIPGSCNSLVDGSSRAGARLQYEGILIFPQAQRLSARGAAAVCCKLRPKADRLTVSFGGAISGDEKCAAHKIGKDRYQEEFGFGPYDMKCGEWRAKGICG